MARWRPGRWTARHGPENLTSSVRNHSITLRNISVSEHSMALIKTGKAGRSSNPYTVFGITKKEVDFVLGTGD